MRQNAKGKGNEKREVALCDVSRKLDQFQKPIKHTSKTPIKVNGSTTVMSFYISNSRLTNCTIKTFSV